MAGAIENFFFAWGAPDERRDAIITEAVTEDVIYRDPRGEVSGAPALCAYVGQFSTAAAAVAAEVVEDNESGETHDVRVRFHGDWGESFGRFEITLDDDNDKRIKLLEGVAE